MTVSAASTGVMCPTPGNSRNSTSSGRAAAMVWECTGGVSRSAEPTTTAADGSYQFTALADGVYTLIKHESSGETVKELERRLRLNDNVMRVMTVIAGPEWEAPAEEGATAAVVTESNE